MSAKETASSASASALVIQQKEAERIIQKRSSTTGKILEERRMDIAKISHHVEQISITVLNDNAARKQKRVLADKITSAKKDEIAALRAADKKLQVLTDEEREDLLTLSQIYSTLCLCKGAEYLADSITVREKVKVKCSDGTVKPGFTRVSVAHLFSDMFELCYDEAYAGDGSAETISTGVGVLLEIAKKWGVAPPKSNEEKDVDKSEKEVEENEAVVESVEES